MTIEQIVLEHLTEALDVPVYIMRPDNAPDSYVIIDKTSGGEDNKVPQATVAIQSYGKTVYDASQLNEQVITAMQDILALPSIGRCKLDNDYLFTDQVRKVPRYQAVFDIRFYK